MYDVIESDIKIEDMIYEIRGVQVMLDSDLAKLFKVETKRINEAVKNNPQKFPKRFSWKLDEIESHNFLVENFDQKIIETRGGRYNNPRVFTEHGIIMLSTILKSRIAIEMSIRIIEAFVNMRHFLSQNQNVYKSLTNINNKLLKQENKIDDNAKRIDELFSKFDKEEQVFLEGQPYSAYRNIIEILNIAKKDIIIVDEYADITILDLIRKIKCNMTLITRDSKRLSNIEIEKYNKEFNNLKVIRNNSFHDRLIIIDNIEIYLIGSSINNIGEKTVMIIKLHNDHAKNTILENVIGIMNNQVKI